MLDSKRAKRRKDLQRKKRQAIKINPFDIKGKNANHLAACSCSMCGNPRKYYNETTIQERKHEVKNYYVEIT